jgi:hypothetical protein
MTLPPVAVFGRRIDLGKFANFAGIISLLELANAASVEAIKAVLMGVRQSRQVSICRIIKKAPILIGRLQFIPLLNASNIAVFSWIK